MGYNDGTHCKSYGSLSGRRFAGCLTEKEQPRTGLTPALAACVIVLAVVIKGLEDIFAFLDEIVTWGGLSTDIFSPLWKTVGIALITRVGTELCKDAGENAMASLVEMTGAFGAILVAIPLFQAVWEMLRSLI